MAVRRGSRSNDDTDHNDDPIDDVVMNDRKNIAAEFGDILEGLSGVDQGAIKGVLYKVPPGQAKYEFIKEVLPPFDIVAIMNDLRETHGGGDYQLRLFVNGRIKKNVNFSIAKTSTSDNPLIRNGGNNMDFIQIMLTQQNQARAEQAALADRQRSDMQLMLTTMMQSAAAQQTAMMQMMGMILPAMMGGKEKTSELLTAFAALQGNKGGGMDETLGLLKTAKDLFSGGSKEDLAENAGDLIGEGLKLAGPLIGSLAKGLENRRAQNPIVQGGMQAPGVFIPPQPAMLPMSVPAEARPDVPVVETGEQKSRFPILDVIKEDVLFLFKRGHDPDLAAEVVLETLEKASIDEAALFELIAAFHASPNWIEELASEGIDLRSNPLWANQFLTALVQLYSDNAGDDDRSDGGEGGAPNNVDHGPPRSGGENGSPHSDTGG
jgi:hypothetical protein